MKNTIRMTPFPCPISVPLGYTEIGQGKQILEGGENQLRKYDDFKFAIYR